LQKSQDQAEKIAKDLGIEMSWAQFDALFEEDCPQQSAEGDSEGVGTEVYRNVY
jgi:hypothetical protein